MELTQELIDHLKNKGLIKPSQYGELTVPGIYRLVKKGKGKFGGFTYITQTIPNKEIIKEIFIYKQAELERLKSTKECTCICKQCDEFKETEPYYAENCPSIKYDIWLLEQELKELTAKHVIS